MDLETRVTNLEKLVDSLVTAINNTKFYTDADIAGVRQSVSEVTPYTETKTAYIDDTEVAFTNVPEGNLTIYFSKPYTAVRDEDRLVIKFEALEEVTPITISII
jgi:hypothetical protein